MTGFYDEVTYKISKLVTNSYSTSFSLGVSLLDPIIRNDIFSIYGFVRFADEIVDTFHDTNKEKLLNDFEASYYLAYREGISLNPILHSFQLTVKKYQIDDALIQAFLKSMRYDLHKKEYDEKGIIEYIYGSADVVGLMCLKVFVYGDEQKYNELKPFAMRLGSAFQKVNFLRDLNNDVTELQRTYFPILRQKSLNHETLKNIIDDITKDFEEARLGILKLPKSSRTGVYTAYLYYLSLLRKIKRTKPKHIMESRIRISNFHKILLLNQAYFSVKANLV
ncbi:MAG: phytoene/squalene synthase family protein [Bacteroidota bacterium]|nr:MAG: phytoene/squalene synthase family protein [Bacteroidota bacterium]